MRKHQRPPAALALPTKIHPWLASALLLCLLAGPVHAQPPGLGFGSDVTPATPSGGLGFDATLKPAVSGGGPGLGFGSTDKPVGPGGRPRPNPGSKVTLAPTTQPPASCAFESALCQPGSSFHLVQYGPEGCPVDSCRTCTPATGDRPECRGVDCSTLVAPPQGCPANQFINITADAAGCPALTCTNCSLEHVGRRPGCPCQPIGGPPPACPAGQFARRDTDSQGCASYTCTACPVLSPPKCPPGNFVAYTRSPEGCPRASCSPCSAQTPNEPGCTQSQGGCAVASKPQCPGNRPPTQQLLGTACQWVCEACPPDLQPPACRAGQSAQRGNDSQGCPIYACVPCPVLTPPACPPGNFVKYVSSPEGCPRARCSPCSAETAGRPECTESPRGCTGANKPQCPGNRPPKQQLLGTACHWVCEGCPLGLQPPVCPAGQYLQHNPAGHCLPWTCRDCDFQHRDLAACRPAADSCPPVNWAVACSAGQFRRVRVAVPESSGCLEVECASCQELDKVTGNFSLADGTAELPAECRRPCPEPLVLCDRGTTAEFSADASGCQTAACRPCRDQETCGTQPACASRRQLDHEPDDCRPGLFYLGNVRIDGCAASVCLPCPAVLATGETRPPGCQVLPAACAAPTTSTAASAAAAAAASTGVFTVGGTAAATASASSSATATATAASQTPANRGLPNCTIGSQRVEQAVNAAGCPSLACVECPASRPACPPGTRESPRPNKWLQCQLFDCREQGSSIHPGGTNPALPPSLVPLDAAGCPKQSWLLSPIEFGLEWIQLDGACRLRRYRTCPAPSVTCRRGELPQTTGGNCEYTCLQQNWSSASTDCFPGQHYLIFIVDANRAKSPFQIRFQVASFISRLASQMTYGPGGVLIGAVFYSGRVLSTINPDECTSPDAFFRRLLLLRYDEDATTATGEAVVAAAQLLRILRRPDAKRSLIVLTDSVTSGGRSLQSAAAQLPASVITYFISLSSVWNPALRSEAENFVSEPGNLIELTSYYLLATSGVQLLFPQCYRACDSARNGLAAYQTFLRYLQDSVHTYEAWLYDAYTSIVKLQEGLETMQYQFESKQIRLELCSRMIAHYKITVQRLQEQLDSLQVMKTQTVNVVDYESTLTQVKQLEQRMESLTVKKSQLVTTLQTVLVQISTAEERLVVLRKTQEEKLAVEEQRIATLEVQISSSWKLLQTLTQELLIKRTSSSNVEVMVQEKETRIQDLLLLNADLATEINSVKTKISSLKTSANSTTVISYTQAQEALASCEARVALEGFSPLLTIRSGDGVRIQETVDSLLRGATYNWMSNAKSAELQLYASLLNFTVGTYSEVKLLFRNSAGQTRAYLTFRVASYDLTNFFDSSNLIACFPWRMESVKETLDLSWSLRSERFPSLLFSALLTESSAEAASATPTASHCASRKGILSLVTDKDGCEDLPGPYPRLRFSPSGQPTTLAEMEELDSLQILVKSLAINGSDPNWLPGLVASPDMPVTLAELLSNGMLSYPPEAAPAALRPGLFYKSLLLRSQPSAFPLIRLRLTDGAGRTQQLVYNGTFERDRIVESTWSRRLLTSARVFATDPAPFGFTIGDASPCEGKANATGVLFFNLDNRCPSVADPGHDWSVLFSSEPDSQVQWSQAERAAFVEIQLRRRDSLASATGAQPA